MRQRSTGVEGVLSRLAPLALAACLDPTQATVRIGTDAPCASQSPAAGSLVVVGINAGPPGSLAEASAPNTTTTSCSDGDVGSIVVYPTDGATEAGLLVVGVVTVAGVEPSVERCARFAKGEDTPPDVASSCIVARRNVAFIDHTMLELPVTLYSACAGIRCDADSTCVPGAPPDASGNPCVSSTVTCKADGSCPDPSTDSPSTSSSSSSGSGAGGAGGGGDGGSGGAGGAGGQGAGYLILPLAQGATDSAALGLSEDGSTVAGVSPMAAPRPVVWRDGVLEPLPMADAGHNRGYALEACGSGDRVIGYTYNEPMGGFTPVRWTRNGGTWAADLFGGVGVAIDCDETGTLVVVDQAGYVVYDIPSGTSSPVTPGGASAMSAEGNFVVGTSTGLGAVWAVAQGPSLMPLGTVPNTTGVLGIDAAGTTAVARGTGGLFRIDLPSLGATPLPGTADDAPRAVSSDMGFRAVGSCMGVQPYACIWDGPTLYSLDGANHPQWPLAPQTVPPEIDHILDAADISRSGDVIAGNARAQDQAQRAYLLTVP